MASLGQTLPLLIFSKYTHRASFTLAAPFDFSPSFVIVSISSRLLFRRVREPVWYCLHVASESYYLIQ
jgi:hypothetical protein